MNLTLAAKSQLIIDKAKELGFDLCGIAEADFLSEEKERFIDWLDKDYHGEMGYGKQYREAPRPSTFS